MLIKALATIIAYDGEMVVINTGETGELRDDLAEQEIASGKAEKAKKSGKAEKAEPAIEEAPAPETTEAP
jgi:hypothetical protein